MARLKPKKANRGATTKNIAVAYIRVSTEEQADTGISLASQRTTARKYVADCNLVFATPDSGFPDCPTDGVYEDAGVSGGTPIDQRPAGRRMMELIRSGRVGNIVVSNLSRLFRSNKDGTAWIDELADLGVIVHILDMGGRTDPDSMQGKMMMGMMSFFADMQRQSIRSATKAALNGKRLRGERLGGQIPYGFACPDGVHLVPNPHEAEAIRLTRTMRAEGVPWATIGRRLNDAGYFPRNGGAWHRITLYRFVEAPNDNDT